MNVILAPYFTSKMDPQRHKQWPIDDYSKIQRWKESIEKLELEGRIFHDELSKEFTREHTSDYVKFIRTNSGYNWSTNDFRFIAYNYYLENHHEHEQIEYVFMTDLSDVTVVQDPFKNMERDNLQSNIITGLDNAGIIATAPWSRMEHYGYIPKYVSLWSTLRDHVLNAGILGGSRHNMIDFTNRMVAEFNEINVPGKNNNMAVFNYVAYNFFKDKIVTGEPICSKFTRFENDRKDVWFIHK